MNRVDLIGRLARDPELRYTAEKQMAVADFSLALDRGKEKDGTSKGADFPRIKVFGKQAENCEKFLKKGSLVGIIGRIQTGKYVDREGKTVWTTDVIAERVEFLEYGERRTEEETYHEEGPRHDNEYPDIAPEDPQQTFAMLDEDVPF